MKQRAARQTLEPVFFSLPAVTEIIFISSSFSSIQQKRCATCRLCYFYLFILPSRMVDFRNSGSALILVDTQININISRAASKQDILFDLQLTFRQSTSRSAGCHSFHQVGRRSGSREAMKRIQQLMKNQCGVQQRELK